MCSTRNRYFALASPERSMRSDRPARKGLARRAAPAPGGAQVPSYNRACIDLDESLKLALADMPPRSEEGLRILQPLMDEELLACFREVRLDEVDHIRAKHSRRTGRPSPLPVRVFEKLMEGQTERESTMSSCLSCRKPLTTTGHM